MSDFTWLAEEASHIHLIFHNSFYGVVTVLLLLGVFLTFRDYPKGGKHHSHTIPEELLAKLRITKDQSGSVWVVTSPEK